MAYTVIWRPRALNKLALLWANAPPSDAAGSGEIDRQMISVAVNQIDALLRSTPETAGESRSGNTRFLAVHPLAVSFEVHEDDRMVHVLAVTLISRRV